MLKQMNTNMTLENLKNEEEHDPTVTLWLLYYIAQHYLFQLNFDQALKTINEAIEHTPTVIELYMVKA
jgi:Tfp pilus assembly protein PilF